MAIDHFLLEQFESGTIQHPVLRLYQWDQATLSLGYHQRVERAVRMDVVAQLGIPIVRRWTGGRAVLHDRELTYSVIAPTSSPFSDRLADNYASIARALERFTLDLVPNSTRVADTRPDRQVARGPMPCFASVSKSEIQAGTRKLIGSSQRVGRAAFLQHGSIPIHEQGALLARITGTQLDMRQYMMTLDELFSAAERELPTMDRLCEALVQAFAETFQAGFEELPLNQDAGRIDELVDKTYGHQEWTQRR